jgi:acetylornithine deacetylase/succinyl-diaminopimelate desuccinylase-like protein/pimeloyl-ACP methyl ester carboxylesterase
MRILAFGLALALLPSVSQTAQAPPITPVPCENKAWTKQDRPATALPGAKLFNGEYAGGLYRIEIPEKWNGELVLYAHGYAPSEGANGLVLSIGNVPLRQHLIENGFAWAASSYRCNGYVPGQGLIDTLALKELFVTTNGGRAPQRTYLVGVSMGGHAALVAAHAMPTAVNGTLAMCAAGPELFDFFVGAGAAAEVITGVTATRESLPTNVKAMNDALGTPPAYTDKGRQLASVQIQLTGGPRPFAVEGLERQFAGNFSIGAEALVQSVTPWHRMATNDRITYRVDDNLGVTAEQLNTRVRRKHAEAALRTLSSPYREVVPFNGRIARPVLTMHTTGDLLVPISMEQILKRAVTAAGRDNYLVQRIYRAPGHCTFSPQETTAAFDSLVAWVRGGTKPAGDNVLGDLSDAGRQFTEPLRPGDPGTLTMKPATAPMAPSAQTAGARQLPAIDWERQKAEILQHYRALVQINSSSPPGNETKVVEYLKEVLEAEEIPTKTFALDPNRANLVARLKGNGSKRPLLILAHTDVVPVQVEKWPVDPFGAVMKDGFIWGRGTIDDKDKLVAMLTTMILIKRSGAVLDRDLIFLAESGEEADPTGVGINFMVNQHFDEIDAEFAVTEGGTARLENGRVSVVQIGTTEKVPKRARLVATGSAGHGSVPRVDNAVTHLAAAVAKVAAWETPMHLNETTRVFFERLAGISPPEKAARYRALLDPQRAKDVQKYLAENEPAMYSVLRTSVVPTMLKAGIGANVIPSEAEATLDIRALPGEDITEFFNQMARVIGDPAVKIVPIPATRPEAPASKLDTEMFLALEATARRMYPGVTVLPSMSTGASDMAQLRAKGIQSYGIGPAVTEEDRLMYGAHSDVERLSEASLYKLVEFAFASISSVAVKK